jgi:hypothetical protein
MHRTTVTAISAPMHDTITAGGLLGRWAGQHVDVVSGSPYTVNYAGRVIGHVLFGLPAANGHRVGTLVPTRDYLDVRAPFRRFITQSREGKSGGEIHDALVADMAALRAAGLSLADTTGATVKTQFLMVMDGCPEDVDPEVLLFAPLIYVAATFPT